MELNAHEQMSLNLYVAYIKSNSLTQNENKRVIKPDTKLKTLLGTDEETVITYFNIQRFMNRHFLKNKSNVTSSEK